MIDVLKVVLAAVVVPATGCSPASAAGPPPALADRDLRDHAARGDPVRQDVRSPAGRGDRPGRAGHFPRSTCLADQGSQGRRKHPLCVGLLAVLALVLIVVVPVAVELMGWFLGRQFTMAPGAIARMVMMTMLLPLAAGVIVRMALPALAARIERPVALVAKVLLPLAALVLLAASLPAVSAAVGDGTVVVMIAFAVVGFIVGHLLGGPHPDHSVVLALSSACRHPAIALAIAAPNFPDEQFGGTIILYLIVSGLVGVPYLAWQRRSVAAVASTARA